MNWLQRYRLRHYLRNSLWILPAAAIVAALLGASLLIRWEQAWGSPAAISVETARSVLAHIETAAPRIAGYVAAYGFLVNLALFIFLIDNIGKMLRPSSAMRAVAMSSRAVIRAVYPAPLEEDSTPAAAIQDVSADET